MKGSIIAMLLCLAAAALCQAREPRLEGGFLLTDGVGTLITDMDSFPVVVNWNNDGKKDLLVGYRYTGGGCNDGMFQAYVNRNTDADPILDGYTILQSEGVPIALPNSGG